MSLSHEALKAELLATLADHGANDRHLQLKFAALVDEIVSAARQDAPAGDDDNRLMEIAALVEEIEGAANDVRGSMVEAHLTPAIERALKALESPARRLAALLPDD